MRPSPVASLAARRLSEDARYPLTRAAASDADTLLMVADAAFEGYASRYLKRLTPDVAEAAEARAYELLSAEAGGEGPPAEADDADALADATASIAVAILLRRGLLRMASAVVVPGAESAAASDAASAASAAFWRKRGVDALRAFVAEKGGDPLKVKTAGYVDELF